jgi:hypothetical protein
MKNGGIIGPKNNTSETTASGVWSLGEQYSAVKNSRWPEFVRPNTKSLLFNSVLTDGSVNIPHVSSLNSLPQITVEAWVNRLSGGASSFPVIIVKSGISEDWSLLYSNSDNGIRFRHEFLTTQGEWRWPRHADNQWVHVAVTFNSTSSSNVPQLYFNGVSQGTPTTLTSASGTAKYGVGAVEIGNRANGVRGHHGYIDEVRIWNVVRTQQQIQATYNTTIKPNSDGLVGYWSFEEGSGSATEDATGNSNGTLIGDVLFSTNNPGI